MIDHYITAFYQWHESLTPTVRLVFDFFVGIIIIRGIIARKITTAIEQLGGKISAALKKRLVRTERDMAIWVHYINQSVDKGHDDTSPIDCEDGACKLV